MVNLFVVFLSCGREVNRWVQYDANRGSVLRSRIRSLLCAARAGLASMKDACSLVPGSMQAKSCLRSYLEGDPSSLGPHMMRTTQPLAVTSEGRRRSLKSRAGLPNRAGGTQVAYQTGYRRRLCRGGSEQEGAAAEHLSQNAKVERLRGGGGSATRSGSLSL